MRKIIWTCWFQGRQEAPDVVRKCLDSWEVRNPGWDLRCLDADTVARYVDVDAYVDLKAQTLTAASLSDILRLVLLHEYGGVWVDATTYCNAPLDEWLPMAAGAGFFAFARPVEDRELASWFLAAAPGNDLLGKWTARCLAYWRGRASTPDYFWMHHQFGELCAVDRDAFRAWQNTPHISADGPHSIQNVGLYEDYDAVRASIDWTVPVFKLTHRLERDRLGPNCLLARLLALGGEGQTREQRDPQPSAPDRPFGLLKVGTENLGDHIQILASEALLRRAGVTPSFAVDRDDAIAHDPPVEGGVRPGIVLNGWFKTNSAEWPPHPAYDPIYIGFHIRLFQSPSLLSAAALEHYAAHGPVGCRDRHTLSMLRAHGVDAFLSHCLSLTFPRRLPDPERQTELFVVSRDTRIVDYLPVSLGPFTFLSQYSGEHDFARNMARAAEMLQTYRTCARLIVTTMLHCALPAIAMGIPVVVFYPPNEGKAHQSDRERFSSLSEIVRVFRPSEAQFADWRGSTPDVSALKLRLIDTFFAMAARWGSPKSLRVEGIAPASALPVPSSADAYDYFADPERLDRLALAKSPDRLRWGAPSNYKPAWAQRSGAAARHIPDNALVLEIGAGTGAFRDLVAGRCRYTGADLQPFDDRTIALDIEADPIPQKPWDAIVLLGVIEYLYDPVAALNKVCAATRTVVCSYCIPRCREVLPQRRARGWVNAVSQRDLVATFENAGFSLETSECFDDSPEDFAQWLFVFTRHDETCSGS